MHLTVVSDNQKGFQNTGQGIFQKMNKCTGLLVASNRLSWLVASLRIFRSFIKGKFDAYML